MPAAVAAPAVSQPQLAAPPAAPQQFSKFRLTGTVIILSVSLVVAIFILQAGSLEAEAKAPSKLQYASQVWQDGKQWLLEKMQNLRHDGLPCQNEPQATN
jgi:hypothetical protein